MINYPPRAETTKKKNVQEYFSVVLHFDFT